MDRSDIVALLGDLVASRTAPDRAGLHARVQQALAATNGAVPALDPLRITISDEFQGVYATVGLALAAAYRVRLELDGRVDVRFGLGRGAVQVVDASINLQDGSAWWSARAAIEAVEASATGGRRALRTGLAAAEDAPAITPELRTAVECVDALFAGLDDASRHVLRSLLTGATQARAAAELGVSGSAVSQRVARAHLAVLADAIARLEEVA